MLASARLIAFSAGALAFVGLVAIRPSLAAAVIAQATTAFHCSTSGNCVTTTSTTGTALSANSTSGAGIIATSGSDAIVGIAASGIGVEGWSSTGTGVFGVSGSGPAFFSQSASGYGLQTFAGGTAIYADNTSSSGAVIQAVSNGGDLYIGTDAATGQGRVAIDHSGNEILAGTLTESGQPQIRTATSVGKPVITYGGRTSSPTLEDFGTAQLRNGQAYVSLESTFATTIDRREKYMVFLSPEGENNGLYVTQKSGHGFAVHESNSGHSTLAFDYRIVAKPYDTTATRLTPTTAFSGLAQSRILRRH